MYMGERASFLLRFKVQESRARRDPGVDQRHEFLLAGLARQPAVHCCPPLPLVRSALHPVRHASHRSIDLRAVSSSCSLLPHRRSTFLVDLRNRELLPTKSSARLTETIARSSSLRLVLPGLLEIRITNRLLGFITSYRSRIDVMCYSYPLRVGSMERDGIRSTL